jgi:2-dehydropantoate 2-reductase
MQLPADPEILIVGPGSMGLMHAALLARAGRRVTLLDHRPERAAALSRVGIRVRGAAGDFWVSIPVVSDASDAASPDLVVFLVKAHSTPAALAHARDAFRPDTVLLTLQNGLGNYELLVEFAGSDRVLGGTTSSGAYRPGDGEVFVAAIGDMRIGGSEVVLPVADAVCALFSDAGLPAQTSDDLQSLLWQKATVNAGINPLGALAGVRNGVLLEVPALRLLLRGLVEEAVDVASRAGVRLDGDMVAAVEEVACRTAENRCSMLQDLEASRPTEIRQISGHIAAVGLQQGGSGWLNETVHKLVEAAERRWHGAETEQT